MKPSRSLRSCAEDVRAAKNGVPRLDERSLLVAAVVQLTSEIASLRAELRAVKGLVVLERPKAGER